MSTVTAQKLKKQAGIPESLLEESKSSEGAVNQMNQQISNSSNNENFGLTALFDETNNVDVIAVQSQDSESDEDLEDDHLESSSSFQLAWFQAKDAEESKSQ